MDPLTQVSHSKVKTALDTNVFAQLTLASVFADALSETKGNIVMISSMVIRHSQPEYAAYKLTKAALHAAAGSLATELGPRGIRVNTVAPGWIWEDVNKMYFEWMAKERGVTAVITGDTRPQPTTVEGFRATPFYQRLFTGPADVPAPRLVEYFAELERHRNSP